MRDLTILSLVAAVLVAVVVAAPSHLEAPKPHHDSYHRSIARKTGGVAPRDWLSDLIILITGQDPSDFLVDVNDTLKKLHGLVVQATGELQDIMIGTTPAAAIEIQTAINDVLAMSLPIINPILQDLELVLPAISRKLFPDVSLIISIILGRSFEDFLNSITVAFVSVENLIGEMLSRLLNVTAIVESGCAQKIEVVMESTLVEAWIVMQPILDVLKQIFPTISRFPLLFPASSTNFHQ